MCCLEKKLKHKTNNTMKMRENLYKGVVPNSHSIDPSLSGTENMKEKKKYGLYEGYVLNVSHPMGDANHLFPWIHY